MTRRIPSLEAFQESAVDMIAVCVRGRSFYECCIAPNGILRARIHQSKSKILNPLKLIIQIPA
jgi:hypothetical protein